jgi:hypothetical protein
MIFIERYFCHQAHNIRKRYHTKGSYGIHKLTINVLFEISTQTLIYNMNLSLDYWNLNIQNYFGFLKCFEHWAQVDVFVVTLFY